MQARIELTQPRCDKLAKPNAPAMSPDNNADDDEVGSPDGQTHTHAIFISKVRH